jgi:hypothetical protein
MKYMILILMPVVLSCAHPVKHYGRSNLNDAVDSSVIKSDEARILIEHSTANVKAGISGKMSNAEVRRLNRPIMDSFYAIYRTLPPEDTLDLYNFRIQMINQVIDFKLKHDH